MIEFKDLSLKYENEIFTKLNFKSTAKKIAISGKSGIGKSSLVKLILGLEKASRGYVKHDYKKISTVFQDDLLIENISALKNIRLVTKKEAKEIIELLSKLGIENPNKKISTFSGGMKRRVAIARALIYDDFDLLILDEPLKGLDLETKDLTIKTILEYSKEKNILLISHDKEDLKSFKIEEILEL